MKKESDHYKLVLDNKEIQTKTVIIATGASARWLGLESEKKYQGRGVHTCATCDGFFYKDKDVMVIGGGDAAMEESCFLTKFAKKVYVSHRRDKLRASKIMQERAKKNSKIEFLWNTEVKKYLGDEKGLTGVKLYNNKTKEEKDMKIDGVFLAIGHIPNSKPFDVEKDETGYIITKGVKTNLPGVFAAGDVMDKRYRQAITAAGTGSKAALEAERFIAE
jgi:thioredoxin reductase (NADPH)